LCERHARNAEADARVGEDEARIDRCDAVVAAVELTLLSGVG